MTKRLETLKEEVNMLRWNELIRDHPSGDVPRKDAAKFIGVDVRRLPEYGLRGYRIGHKIHFAADEVYRASVDHRRAQ